MNSDLSSRSDPDAGENQSQHHLEANSAQHGLAIRGSLRNGKKKQLAQFLLRNLKHKNKRMVRSKSDLPGKTVPLRHGASFTFRRIQARELYEPLPEGDANTRVKFRVRLYQPGRNES